MAVPYGRRATDHARAWRLSWIEVYLGHGRMTEACLVFVKLQFAAILLFVPRNEILIIAFEDIPVHAQILAVPFLMAALPSFVGLVLNALGYDASKWFRIFGASIGIGIWVFLLAKNCLIGNYASATNPWMLMAILASIWIIRRGMLGLPRPGAPGAE